MITLHNLALVHSFYCVSLHAGFKDKKCTIHFASAIMCTISSDNDNVSMLQLCLKPCNIPSFSFLSVLRVIQSHDYIVLYLALDADISVWSTGDILHLMGGGGYQGESLSKLQVPAELQRRRSPGGQCHLLRCHQGDGSGESWAQCQDHAQDQTHIEDYEEWPH